MKNLNKLSDSLIVMLFFFTFFPFITYSAIMIKKIIKSLTSIEAAYNTCISSLNHHE